MGKSDGCKIGLTKKWGSQTLNPYMPPLFSGSYLFLSLQIWENLGILGSAAFGGRENFDFLGPPKQRFLRVKRSKNTIFSGRKGGPVNPPLYSSNFLPKGGLLDLTPLMFLVLFELKIDLDCTKFPETHFSEISST